jgi:hypothetical protein
MNTNARKLLNFLLYQLFVPRHHAAIWVWLCEFANSTREGHFLFAKSCTENLSLNDPQVKKKRRFNINRMCFWRNSCIVVVPHRPLRYELHSVPM